MKQINKWRKTDVGRKRRRLRILLDAVCLVFLCVLVFTAESSAANHQCSSSTHEYYASLYVNHGDTNICRCDISFTGLIEYPPSSHRNNSYNFVDFNNKVDVDCIKQCVIHWGIKETCENPSAWMSR